MSDEAENSGFAGIYDATAEAMLAEFKKLRSGLNHSGARGDAAEEIVREFLADALPASLGVAVGQVVDSNGSYSGQSDVIIYNAERTPMLFRSAQGGRQTVPIEGVVAVVEIKSVLQKKDLTQLVSHARKLKSLEAKAYIPRAIESQYQLYDQQWARIPPLYSVFAFSADGLYVEELNAMQAGTPLHQRVDNLCALGRGLVLNVCLTGDIDNPETLFSFSATATRLSRLGEVPSENPLLPWFALNSTIWVQSDCPPINLSAYVQDQLRLQATMPSQDSVEFRDELMRQMGQKIGVSSDVLSKVGGISKEPLTPDEILQLVEPYQQGLFVPGTPESKALFEALAQVGDSERAAALSMLLAHLDSEDE